jgi:DNA-binding CsgD family transcriptional regulator
MAERLRQQANGIGSSAEQVGLLERETELGTLQSAIDAAASGGGRFVGIEGPAGIGKTSLLAETRARAAEQGFRLLHARGSELEATFPFGVVRQLFEPVLARADAEERRTAFEGAAALAGSLFGVADAQTVGGDEGAFAVLHGLYWLTANLADDGPLLIAVDDLHWADPASLRWIPYLARRLDGLPVLVVATLRHLEADADPALAGLVSDSATLSLRPAPLTLAAATEIVSASLGLAEFDEVAAACYDATDGNPLLLRELLNALSTVSLPEEPDEVIAEVHRLAPEVVLRRVKLELAKLGSDAADLAEAEAVLGDDVELRHAAELANLDDTRAREAAGRLVRAELLARDRLLRFAHPLLRSSVYNALPDADRDVFHERAAAVLARVQAPIERIAVQLVLAPASGRAEVVRTLREAAQNALADGASESAVALLRRALVEPPADAERADVLLELAAAEARVGAREQAERLREALPLLDDASRRVQARIALARSYFWFSKDEQAVAEMEAALADEDSADAALRRTLEAEYFVGALRLPDLHEATLARLRRLDVGDADDAGARMLLALKAYGNVYEGVRIEEAVELAERALADGMPADEAPSWAHWGAVSTLLIADAFEPALRVVDEVLAEARRRGAVYLFCGASMVRASILHARGALAEAEADIRGAVEALPEGAMIMSIAYGLLARVLVERGGLEEAGAALADVGADGQLEETFAAIPLLQARGALRRAQGQPRAAAADAFACRRAAEAVGFRNPGGGWTSEGVLALLADGETERARELALEDLARSRRWGAPRTLGRALRTLGLVEGGEKGLTGLRESVLALEQSPALLERAYSLVDLGSALRRGGKKIEARDRLRAGLDLAQRCGAEPLAERAREELIAAGAKPRSRALSGAGSLTPSERRIAGMAAEGMTNREIAQALFVTPRTVEMHLSNAFRKLEIGSRTQLTDSLAG